MSQRTILLGRADAVRGQINSEDSPKRKVKLIAKLEGIKLKIKNIEHYGNEKGKPDGIPIGVDIGVPRA